MSTAAHLAREGCKILYSPPLHNFARKLVGVDADDVIQDAGVKLVRIIEAGTVPRSMQAIVFLLVKHAAFNLIKARKHNAARPHAFDVGEAGAHQTLSESTYRILQLEDPRAASEHDLAHALDLAKAGALLDEGLAMIPEQYARQLVKSFVDEEPIRGQVLAFGTAASRNSRAKEWLLTLDCVEQAGRLAGVG